MRNKSRKENKMNKENKKKKENNKKNYKKLILWKVDLEIWLII